MMCSPYPPPLPVHLQHSRSPLKFCALPKHMVPRSSQLSWLRQEESNNNDGGDTSDSPNWVLIGEGQRPRRRGAALLGGIPERVHRAGTPTGGCGEYNAM